MRATLLAFTLAALGISQAGSAQNLAVPGQQLVALSWASNDSANVVAARQMDSQYQIGTKMQSEFTPQTLTSEVGQNLASRLDASLERQLQQSEPEPEEQVSAN